MDTQKFIQFAIKPSAELFKAFCDGIGIQMHVAAI